MDGPGALVDVQAVTRDSHGRFYILQSSVAHEVLVFNQDGQFASAIERKGQGPGEYRGLSVVHLTDEDSLYLFDGGNTRLTVLSPSSEVVRTGLLTGLVERVAAMSDGTMVVNARINTPERIGLPLHVLAHDGNVLRSFGAEEAVYRPDAPWLLMRSITPARANTVWAAHRTQYRLELWSIG
jgi:hypothetical protein